MEQPEARGTTALPAFAPDGTHRGLIAFGSLCGYTTTPMSRPLKSRSAVAKAYRAVAIAAADLPADAEMRALRAIAGFEVLKGLLAVALVLGLLDLLHHDVHAIAVSLMGHIGLKPGDHYPAMALHDLDQLLAFQPRTLLLTAGGYALLRFAEAYGLWSDRRWGEWLGALSGALYLPFEGRHLIHSPSLASALVVVANLAVVGFLAWRLWRRRGKAGA